MLQQESHHRRGTTAAARADVRQLAVGRLRDAATRAADVHRPWPPQGL